MTEENTPYGETLEGMKRDLAEVAADLPRRRLVVRAEVLGRLVEVVERLEREGPRSRVSLAQRYASDDDAVTQMEAYFIQQAAELVHTVTNLAMQRGAGVPVPSPQELLKEQDDRWKHRQPPATAESLGEDL